jgi:hypothetical protein
MNSQDFIGIILLGPRKAGWHTLARAACHSSFAAGNVFQALPPYLFVEFFGGRRASTGAGSRARRLTHATSKVETSLPGLLLQKVSAIHLRDSNKAFTLLVSHPFYPFRMS